MTNAIKKTIVVLLAIMLVCTIFCAVFITSQNSESAYADGAMDKVKAIVSGAITGLFGDEAGAVTTKSIITNVFTDIGYANAAILFLRLVGVMEDPTTAALANIQEQLNIINSKLTAMDGKLDTIISEMAKISGQQKFIDRTTAARDYRTAFNNYNVNYKENGLNVLVTQFKSMQTDAIKNWYNSETAAGRVYTITDNSSVTLLYDLVDAGTANEKYVLRATMDNGVPAGFNGRYVVLSDSFLPIKSDVRVWNIDTYRAEVENFIKDHITSNFGDLNKQNYDELVVTNTEAIEQIAKDAVDTLIYRTTAEAINESSAFANNAVAKFDNYAQATISSENGFDAIVRALFYTHAFEYEVSDLIKEIYQEMVFEAAYYGSFVKGVLSMSNDITQEEKNNFNTRLCNLILNLEKGMDDALTDRPNYCYLTNTLLYYGVIENTYTATLSILETADTHESSHSYRGFWANTGNRLYRFDGRGNAIYRQEGATYDYNKNYLIGDDDAALLSMTLKANGISADHNYLAEHLLGVKDKKYSMPVVKLNDDSELSLDSGLLLDVQRVSGSYLPATGSTLCLASLPSKLSREYVAWHRMTQGTVNNFATGTLTANTTLTAMAVYAESHWYWRNDETAVLSYGESSGINVEKNAELETLDSRRWLWDYRYDVHTSFNCIMQEVFTPESSGSNTPNPVDEYREEVKYVDPVLDTEPTTYERYTSPVTPEKKTSIQEDVTDLFNDAKADDSKVVISVGALDLIFDGNAVNAIAGKTTTLSANVLKENHGVDGAELVIDVSLSGATFENGKATVTVSIDKEVPKGKKVKVYYINGNEKVDMNATYNGEEVTFDTNHFSKFAVVFEKEGLSGGAIAGIVIACVVFVSVPGFCIFWFIFRKRKEKAIKAAEKNEE